MASRSPSARGAPRRRSPHRPHTNQPRRSKKPTFGVGCGRPSAVRRPRPRWRPRTARAAHRVHAPRPPVSTASRSPCHGPVSERVQAHGAARHVVAVADDLDGRRRRRRARHGQIPRRDVARGRTRLRGSGDARRACGVDGEAVTPVRCRTSATGLGRACARSGAGPAPRPSASRHGSASSPAFAVSAPRPRSAR